MQGCGWQLSGQIVSTVVLRNVTCSMGHSTVNMMVWCYSLIVGEVSVVYFAMVPDCKDIINVSSFKVPSILIKLLI